MRYNIARRRTQLSIKVMKIHAVRKLQLQLCYSEWPVFSDSNNALSKLFMSSVADNYLAVRRPLVLAKRNNAAYVSNF